MPTFKPVILNKNVAFIALPLKGTTCYAGVIRKVSKSCGHASKKNVDEFVSINIFISENW